MRRAWAANFFLICLFAVQIVFAYNSSDVKPQWQVVPEAPTPRALQLMSFGDVQFLYRDLVLDVQNFGDTGGRVTALKDYNIELLIKWFEALDTLDPHANHHLVLATRYFSQSQDKAALRPLVEYVSRSVAASPERKWVWLADAVRIAQVRIQDPQLALRLAQQMSSYDFPEMSATAFQFAAYLHETVGDFAGAAAEMRLVKERLAGRVNRAEIRWMNEFIAAMDVKADVSEIENRLR